MEVEFTSSFVRDLKKIADKSLLEKIKSVILELEKSNSLFEMSNVVYIVNSQNFYRIRIGDYRIGIKFENQIVKLIRCLNRREIYRKFP